MLTYTQSGHLSEEYSQVVRLTKPLSPEVVAVGIASYVQSTTFMGTLKMCVWGGAKFLHQALQSWPACLFWPLCLCASVTENIGNGRT